MLDKVANLFAPNNAQLVLVFQCTYILFDFEVVFQEQIAAVDQLLTVALLAADLTGGGLDSIFCLLKQLLLLLSWKICINVAAQLLLLLM